MWSHPIPSREVNACGFVINSMCSNIICKILSELNEKQTQAAFLPEN